MSLQEITNARATSDDKSVVQVDLLNDDIPSIPKEKEHISSVNGETYSASEKELSCTSQKILSLVNSHGKCAKKLDDISFLPSINNQNIFNEVSLNIPLYLLSQEGSRIFNKNEENLNVDSINIQTNLSTDFHTDEAITSDKPQEILGLPVNLYNESCDQHCSYVKSQAFDNDKVSSIESDVNYVEDGEKPCRNNVRDKKDPVKNIKKYICDVCTKKFRCKSALQQHTRVHTGERPFACNMCEKKFMDKKTLVRHIRIHTCEKSFVCEVCQKAFLEKKNLMQHVFIHTGERPHACEVCQKRFKVKRDLKIHFATHSDETPFSCEVCRKQFHTQNALNKHLRVHTRVHNTLIVEKAFVCGVCQKAFKNTSALTEHLIVHTGEKPHICNVCQSSFTRKSSLTRHYLRHTGEKPYTCEYCQKVFSLKYQLSQHIRIHSDDKPFVCEVCRNTFRSVSALNSHFATHTGERPHLCNICQTSFTRKSSLIRHLQKHDNGKSNSDFPRNVKCKMPSQPDVKSISD